MPRLRIAWCSTCSTDVLVLWRSGQWVCLGCENLVLANTVKTVDLSPATIAALTRILQHEEAR